MEWPAELVKLQVAGWDPSPEFPQKHVSLLCARHRGFSGGHGPCSKIPLTSSCRAM